MALISNQHQLDFYHQGLILSFVITLASCNAVVKPDGDASAIQQYQYVSKNNESQSVKLLGRLVMARSQHDQYQIKDPHLLSIEQQAVGFRALALDLPIDTASGVALGEPGYMPPEKNIRLLQLIFISGGDEMAMFDQNIGKNARLTCESRHLHPLDTWGMTKVNCSVLSIELEP